MSEKKFLNGIAGDALSQLKILGENIREARIARNFTQEELAARSLLMGEFQYDNDWLDSTWAYPSKEPPSLPTMDRLLTLSNATENLLLKHELTNDELFLHVVLLPLT